MMKVCLQDIFSANIKFDDQCIFRYKQDLGKGLQGVMAEEIQMAAFERYVRRLSCQIKI